MDGNKTRTRCPTHFGLSLFSRYAKLKHIGQDVVGYLKARFHVSTVPVGGSS
jgi:hypothetical protein